MFPSPDYDPAPFGDDGGVTIHNIFSPVNDRRSEDAILREKIKNAFGDISRNVPTELMLADVLFKSSDSKSTNNVPEWIIRYKEETIKTYENALEEMVERIYKTGEGGGYYFDLASENLHCVYIIYDMENNPSVRHRNFIIRLASNYWKRKNCSDISIEEILSATKRKMKEQFGIDISTKEVVSAYNLNDHTNYAKQQIEKLEKFIKFCAENVWHIGNTDSLDLKFIKQSIYGNLIEDLERMNELNHTKFYSWERFYRREEREKKLQFINEKQCIDMICSEAKMKILECIDPRIAERIRNEAPEKLNSMLCNKSSHQAFADSFKVDIPNHTLDAFKQSLHATNELRTTCQEARELN